MGTPFDFLDPEEAAYNRRSRLIKIMQSAGADYRVAWSVVHTILAGMPELHMLDKARQQGAWTKLGVDRAARDLRSLAPGAVLPPVGTSLADALMVELAAIPDRAPPGDGPYREGYLAGRAAFARRVERRIAAIRGSTDDLTRPAPPDVPPPAALEPTDLARYLARVAPDPNERRLARLRRVQGVLSRHPALPAQVTAESLLAALPELETLDRVRDWLDTLRGRHAAIQAKLAEGGWSEPEVRWREAFARELRRPAAEAPPGEHDGGDPFLIGFIVATRIAVTHLIERADNVNGPVR
ncbi:MAG TPA: hypothetical protein VK453_26605 [Micromonosporaceae bacterium]|nr:hypothetical protein [Micromonosporaceae bacterium]